VLSKFQLVRHYATAAGSSAPELFTSTMSLVSSTATNELGVATIVGSAVFNILIIIAATVIFAGGGCTR
jgi:Ca2+/Na+ antiporter